VTFRHVNHHHPRAIGRDEVRASLVRRTANDGTLYVRFGVGVAQALGAERNGRLDLQWGEGDDLGRILLTLARPGRGALLKFPGSSTCGTLEATFGWLPKEPLAGSNGRTASLTPGKRSPVPVDWERGPEGGVIVRLPDDWWRISDPEAELAERVKAMLLKGADDAAVVRATRIAPERLVAIKTRIKAELRTGSFGTAAEIARIRSGAAA
jgi:hypothetical protein